MAPSFTFSPLEGASWPPVSGRGFSCWGREGLEARPLQEGWRREGREGREGRGAQPLRSLGAEASMSGTEGNTEGGESCIASHGYREERKDHRT